MNQLPLEIDNARGQAGKVENQSNQRSDLTPPASTGQCGQVLNLIRRHQPLLSLRLTSHSLGTPEWPRPGFFDGGA